METKRELKERPQRNVTLEISAELAGKPFPCPVCKMSLPIELTQRDKPYCTCNVCGIQIFFRGKTGIKRLQLMLESVEPLSEDYSSTTAVVALYNRLEKLREQEVELEEKRGIFFRNQVLEDAIATLDGEIREMESGIRKARKTVGRKK